MPYFNFLTVLYSLRSKIRNVKWQIWIIQLDCSLFGAETWNINSCVILSIKNDTTKFQPLARFKYWCWRRRLLLLCSRAVAPAAGCSAAVLQEATNHCRGHAALQQLGSGCPHSASSHRHTNLLFSLNITLSHHVLQISTDTFKSKQHSYKSMNYKTESGCSLQQLSRRPKARCPTLVLPRPLLVQNLASL